MKDHPSQWIHSGLTCRDVAEWATDYLEDRLPALTTIRIGLHLTSCADCRSYVMQIGLVSSALRSLPKLYPSPVNRLRLSERFAGRHAN
jgi:predicted anti-sigma-YlaC factor YlaD